MTKLHMHDQAGNQFSGNQNTIILKAIAAERRGEKVKVFDETGQRLQFSARLDKLSDAGYSVAAILSEFVTR